MALSEETRKQTATFGGDRFPMPNKTHAKLALEDLPLAKNISGPQKQQVHSRALRMLAAKRALKKA
jgi:hypothetical protein